MPTLANPLLANMPAQAAQYAAQQASLGPPPDDSVALPEQQPAPQPVFAAPKVTGPTAGDRQIANDQARLEKIRWQQDNPWGTANNHPGVGGKIAHVLSVAGNIAGDIFAPAQMALIPGTQLHRQEEESGLSNRLNKEIGDESREENEGALTAKTQQDTQLAPGKAESEEKLQGAKAGNLESETAQRNQPDLARAYAHRVNQVLTEGGDPAQDAVAQHLADAITSIQKQTATPPGTKTVQLEVGGKPHQVLVDERTGATVKDLGESGEKPPVVRVETPGEARGAKNDLLKAYQPTLDSAERMNVMTESYEKAVKDHDQQAMLNLLANHLGMTMGLQKGARITKDLYQEAAHSTPWLKSVGAKFDSDGYLAGVTLNNTQMRQMVDLAQSRYAEDAKKSRSTAQYLGAKDDGPDRVPGRGTMNFYLGKTGGDPTKAKQLAAQDGWTVR